VCHVRSFTNSLQPKQPEQFLRLYSKDAPPRRGDLMRRFLSLTVIFLLVLALALFAGLKEGLSVEQKIGTETAEETKRLDASPKIKFDELTYDFGKAFQLATLKHTFTFRNVGTGTLHIKKVKTG